MDVGGESRIIMRTAVGMFAGGERVFFSFVGATASTTGLSFVHHASRLPGDLNVLVYGAIRNENVVPGIMSTPTGWTAHVNASGGIDNHRARIQMWSKIWVGDEDTVFPLTSSNNERSTHSLFFRPTKPIVTRSWVGADTDTGGGEREAEVELEGEKQPIIMISSAYSDFIDTPTNPSFIPTFGATLLSGLSGQASQQAHGTNYKIWNPGGGADIPVNFEVAAGNAEGEATALFGGGFRFTF